MQREREKKLFVIGGYRLFFGGGGGQKYMLMVLKNIQEGISRYNFIFSMIKISDSHIGNCANMRVFFLIVLTPAKKIPTCET